MDEQANRQTHEEMDRLTHGRAGGSVEEGRPPGSRLCLWQGQADAKRRGGLRPDGGGLGSTRGRAAGPPHSPFARLAAAPTLGSEQNGLGPRAPELRARPRAPL